MSCIESSRLVLHLSHRTQLWKHNEEFRWLRVISDMVTMFPAGVLVVGRAVCRRLEQN